MSKISSEHSAKKLARLAAVQGLYQMALLPRPVQDIVRDFREHPSVLLQEIGDGDVRPDIDLTLFTSIMSGVHEYQDFLDAMIAGALDAKVSVERIEILLRAILRCGVYELHHHTDIVAGIIINDYLDVTHAFFNAKEPGLVNAVLDKLAKNLRAA
jgi:N utilization substance protein B